MTEPSINENLCIETDRLRLRCWRESDRDAFAAMLADPESMRDYGTTLDRTASDRKFNGYRESFRRHGFARWLTETRDGRFLGYVGIMAWYGEDHPLGDHEEVGWRCIPDAWGQGYATEAARVAIADGFDRVGLERILAYTSPDNRASQAVMTRLSMRREESLDFSFDHPESGYWTGLVWRALRDQDVNVRYTRLSTVYSTGSRKL